MIKDLDLKKKIIYPACVMFCIIVFLYFLMAMAAGINVFDSETVYTQVYDGVNDSNEISSEVVLPKALPIQTLLGILLFSLTVKALGFLDGLDMNRTFIELVKYLGTVMAFFMFVIVLSGAASSEGGLAVAFIACLFVSVVYFAVRGIKMLVKNIEDRRLRGAYEYFSKICSVFTAIVFAVSIFALVSGLNVIVKLKEDKTFIGDSVLQNVFVTVMTPLAPTVQNYLRYLATAAVSVISVSVLRTSMNKVAKIALNFVILASGFVLIWIMGVDYFRLVRVNAMTACIVFLSVYAVILIAVCVINYVRARKAEDEGEYEAQFSKGKILK